MANTMTATMNEERIDGTGGIRIFVRSWRPETQPRAVVVICHGVKSHSGYYVAGPDDLRPSQNATARTLLDVAQSRIPQAADSARALAPQRASVAAPPDDETLNQSFGAGASPGLGVPSP